MNSITNLYSKIFEISTSTTATQILGSTIDDKWAPLQNVISALIPILWIATAIVSTIWLVIKYITANFQSATGDQGKYEKAKKAKKRALIAWVFGLLWPVVFLVAWPIAGMIYKAITGKDDFPQLFVIGDTGTGLSPETNLEIINQIKLYFR